MGNNSRNLLLFDVVPPACCAMIKPGVNDVRCLALGGGELREKLAGKRVGGWANGAGSGEE